MPRPPIWGILSSPASSYTRIFHHQGVSFEYNTEKPRNVLALLANLEESGTGMSHEVGLAALGIDSNIDFRYYYLFTLGKGNGTGVDGPYSSLLNTFIFAANLSSASCTLCC